MCGDHSIARISQATVSLARWSLAARWLREAVRTRWVRRTRTQKARDLKIDAVHAHGVVGVRVSRRGEVRVCAGKAGAVGGQK